MGQARSMLQVPTAAAAEAGIAPTPRTRASSRSSRGHRLAGIQDVGRVECAFEGAHQLDGVTMLSLEHVELVRADAVLAGAGAAHGDRPQGNPPREVFGALALVRIRRIEEHHEMEVAVADVSD